MTKRNRKIMVIKIPSFLDAIKKVRGVKIPACKIHRPKKGGKYYRPSAKRLVQEVL